MEKEPLKLEQIAPYLPCKLVVKNLNYERDYCGVQYSELSHLYPLITREGEYLWHYKTTVGNCASIEECKPVLNPLDNYKDINSKAMQDLNIDLPDQFEIIDLANQQISLSSLSYGVAQICFQNHIDVFRLIEKGLAEAKKSL